MQSSDADAGSGQIDPDKIHGWVHVGKSEVDFRSGGKKETTGTEMDEFVEIVAT